VSSSLSMRVRVLFLTGPTLCSVALLISIDLIQVVSSLFGMDYREYQMPMW
jgi:hypothetical protein